MLHIVEYEMEVNEGKICQICIIRTDEKERERNITDVNGQLVYITV